MLLVWIQAVLVLPKLLQGVLGGVQDVFCVTNGSG